MSWVFEELSSIRLNDKRLELRSKCVLEALAKSPSASIPCAFSSWAETHAAYQFMGNKKVNAKGIISPHIQSTIKRIGMQDTVLMLQDTTEITYPTHTKKQGIGPIHNDHIRGLQLHPTLAVTPDNLCLGVVNDHSWYRETLHRTKDHKSKPIEEKESYRWLQSLRVSTDIARQCPNTRVINIADREADIYELFTESSPLQTPSAYWIIRSAQKRVLDSDDVKKQDIWSEVKSQPSVATISFELKSKERDARTVTQEIKFKKVKIQCPKTKDFKPVELTVVLANEINPPQGQIPIQWILLTNLEITNATQALEVIEFYICRWQIEIYFKVLKSGCNIEKKQFTIASNLNVCIRLYMIIAWRIMYLTHLARSCPEMSCEQCFEPHEWQSLCAVIGKGVIPKHPPNMAEMLGMIAVLGGYIKNKAKPAGVKVIWLGLKRMYDFSLAWQAFNTHQKNSS